MVNKTLLMKEDAGDKALILPMNFFMSISTVALL